MRPSKAALWKAIRGFCLECMGGSKAEIEKCTAPNCPLYPWRLGAGNSTYKSGRKSTGRPFLKLTNRAAESISGAKNGSLEARQ
jgi:hypothetical protein